MNSLIYGKNPTERIVSIEVGDDTAELFRELEDGTVVSETVPNTHYILFDRQRSPKMKRLAGDQHYKYIMEYSSREAFQEVLSQCYYKKYDLNVIRNPKEALMIKDGYTYFKGMNAKDVSILSFDIEDTFGIGETLRKDGLVLCIANTFRKQGKVTRKQFLFDDYPSQREMIDAWVEWVNQMNPSVLIGYNVFGHDLRVMEYAARINGTSLNIGRDGSSAIVAKRNSQFRKDGSQSYDYRNILVYGREVVDVWFLVMKYDVAARREYESYKMKEVIAHEGLEKTDRVHYDASTIAENYKKPDEWAKIKAYNADDGDDPLKLYDLIIPSFFYYTQAIPRSFQTIINSATGSQINSWMVRSYLQQGHSIAQKSEGKPFEGAISFGVPGVHKNVFKIDVQSLYPNIILSYQIHDKKKDPQANFLKFMQFFTEQRVRDKEEFERTNNRLFSDLSDSRKININSGYGFLGTSSLNYNYPDGAAKVTEIGREILIKAIHWATGRETLPTLDANNAA